MPVWQVGQCAHVANSFGVQLIVPLSLPLPPLKLFLLFPPALSLPALKLARTLCSHLFLFLDCLLSRPKLEGTSHNCDHANKEGSLAQIVELGIFLLLFPAGRLARAGSAGGRRV
jgi:hypothetical protein